jgi:predicted ATPase
VVAPGRDRALSILEPADEPVRNLPIQHSSFVGRDRELAEIAALLRDARIVTLTGVGGVGKTRLALRVAAQLRARFRHDVWFVELAGVRDPKSVVDTVAVELGVSPRRGTDLVETLAGFLRSKDVLVVLDNCEHLLGSVVDLVRALERRCPQLVVLATSREALGIAGERIFAVAPMELPRSRDREGVSGSEAARLFVDRAVAVKSDFGVTDTNAGAIAEVVQRLDGIPLALELAAARIPVLSPTQLAHRLTQRFRVLSRGERGAIERHATMRAAIDWSYDLLTADQQRLLARLSVFAGGCGLEAAEAVGFADGIDDADVLDLLGALVARSLVVVDDVAEGDRRYRLLETIRQYAEERLQDPERVELGRRHADFYAEFAETAARGLRGPDQLRWLQQVDLDLENLRTAMTWAIVSNDAVLAERFLWSAAQTEAGALAAALSHDAEAVLELPNIQTIDRYPFALTAGALAAQFHGMWERAEQLCAAALHAVAEPDDELEGWTAVVRMNVARIAHGDLRVAIEQQERAATSFRRWADPYHLGRVLNILANLRASHGDLDRAIDDAREALSLARRTGNPGLTSAALAGLALVLVDREPERSRTLIAESLELIDRLGAVAADELALVLTLTAAARLGERHLVLTRSRPALERGFSSVVRLGVCLEATAAALAADLPDAAATLHGHVDALCPGLTHAEPQVLIRARAIALVDRQRSETQSEHSRARGAAMTAAEGIAYTLDSITRALAVIDTAVDPATRTPTMRRRSGLWDITYRTESAIVPDTKGFRDLAVLLSHPGRDIHVLELVGSPVDGGASIEVVDRRALAEYRQRLSDLDEDRAEAEGHHDIERLARAEAERAALLEELRSVTSLGGKSRLTGAHASERARKAVGARIKEAIRRLQAPMPQLAAHLDQAMVTGTWCRYRADASEVWHVET